MTKGEFIGRAGEHLVASDLLAHGFQCFMCDGKDTYDVVADIGGRLIKIQVKTAGKHTNLPQRKKLMRVYQYNARRHGKNGRFAYADGDADLAAYVMLDRKAVAYLPGDELKATMVLKTADFQTDYFGKRGRYAEELTIDVLLKEGFYGLL